MHRIRVLNSSPAIGLALWCLIGMAPAAHAVVPCTVATSAGPVTQSLATLGQCVERLQRSASVPDAEGRVYGQFGPIRLAVTPQHALRYYEDNGTWSVLDGHGGWAGRVPASKASRPVPVAMRRVPAQAPPQNRVTVAKMVVPKARRLSFSEALAAALGEPLSEPASVQLQPVDDTAQVLRQALVKHGFSEQAPDVRACGVRVARQWYRLATPSLPDCASQLAVVGREAPRLRMVTAEWNGQELWLGPDAVYRKGPRGAWAVAEGF
jgi:hypothetical protein